jgi:hypothetical protein
MHRHSIQIYVSEPNPFGTFDHTESPLPITRDGGGVPGAGGKPADPPTFSGYVKLVYLQAMLIEQDRVNLGQIDNLEADHIIKIEDTTALIRKDIQISP